MVQPLPNLRSRNLCGSWILDSSIQNELSFAMCEPWMNEQNSHFNIMHKTCIGHPTWWNLNLIELNVSCYRQLCMKSSRHLSSTWSKSSAVNWSVEWSTWDIWFGPLDPNLVHILFIHGTSFTSCTMKPSTPQCISLNFALHTFSIVSRLWETVLP